MLRIVLHRLLVIGLLGLAWVSPALAHAVLLGASPADGQRLDTSPEAIVLTFNEPVSPVSLRVLDASGTTMAGPDGIAASGAKLLLPLPQELPPGRYLVSYRVTSVDAHPVAGSIAFGIGVAADEAAAPPTMADGIGWLIAAPFLRLIADLGLLAAAGLALFTGFVMGRDNDGLRGQLAGRRRIAASVAMVAATLGIAVQGGLLGDLPLASLAGFEPWRLGFASTTGRSAALAVLGTALLLPRTARPRTLMAVAIIAASFAASGHAAAAPPRWLAIIAVALHTAGMAFWLGSLVGLEAALARGPLRRITATVRRFTRLAVPSVIGLLLAGSLIACLQIRDPQALFAGNYSWLLALKLVLVAALLCLALYNNRWLTPRLARGDGSAAAVLRKSIRAELLCIVLILIVTVMLGRTPPPRALAQEQATRPSIGIVTTTQGRMALLELAPTGSGSYAVTVSLLDPAGEPLAADDVILHLANPLAGIEPLSRRLVRRAPGTYAGTGPLTIPAGRWSVRVDARTGDFDKLIFETEARTR
jgi:copper transport protein